MLTRTLHTPKYVESLNTNLELKSEYRVDQQFQSGAKFWFSKLEKF